MVDGRCQWNYPLVCCHNEHILELKTLYTMHCRYADAIKITVISLIPLDFKRTDAVGCELCDIVLQQLVCTGNNADILSQIANAIKKAKAII